MQTLTAVPWHADVSAFVSLGCTGNIKDSLKVRDSKPPLARVSKPPLIPYQARILHSLSLESSRFTPIFNFQNLGIWVLTSKA